MTFEAAKFGPLHRNKRCLKLENKTRLKINSRAITGLDLGNIVLHKCLPNTLFLILYNESGYFYKKMRQNIGQNFKKIGEPVCSSRNGFSGKFFKVIFNCDNARRGARRDVTSYLGNRLDYVETKEV